MYIAYTISLKSLKICLTFVDVRIYVCQLQYTVIFLILISSISNIFYTYINYVAYLKKLKSL